MNLSTTAHVQDGTGLGLLLQEAAEHTGYGVSTLRRHIKDGHIPAVKAKGRIYVRPEDLDAFLTPQPIRVTDASLEAWAERMAAKAPAFRPEQRNVIVTAFATALGGE